MKKNNRSPVFDAFGLAASIGLQIAASVAVGLLAGRWLDSRFETSPWCTVAGILLGIAAGLWSTYKRIIKLS